MNVLLLSPHFPPPVWRYARALADEDVSVLGVADVPFRSLPEELRRALTDYVQVSDLEKYDEVEKAARLMAGRHGRIHRLDSLNEHWLVHEGRLREALHVHGPRPEEVARWRSKTAMRALLRSRGLPCTEGEPCRSPEQIRAFVQRVGLPVVFKPDVGVGAQRTCSATTAAELDAVLAGPIDGLVVERFARGRLTSFDGLTDHEGRILCFTSHIYGAGVMETVNEKRTASFHSRREIPARLESLGRRAVTACGLRERFFHIELFEEPDGEFRLLEVNVRPPGGYIVEMMNIATEGDLYRLWAKVIAGRAPAEVSWQRHHHVAHVGRRAAIRYRHSHEEVVQRLGNALVWHGDLPPLLATAMGDHVYIVRDDNEAALIGLMEVVSAC